MDDKFPEEYQGEKPRDHAKTNDHKIVKVERQGKKWSVCNDCAYEEPGTPADWLPEA